MVGFAALALVVGLTATGAPPEGTPEGAKAALRAAVRPMGEAPRPALTDAIAPAATLGSVDLRGLLVWSAIFPASLVAGGLLLYLAGRAESTPLPQALDDVELG